MKNMFMGLGLVLVLAIFGYLFIFKRVSYRQCTNKSVDKAIKNEVNGLADQKEFIDMSYKYCMRRRGFEIEY